MYSLIGAPLVRSREEGSQGEGRWCTNSLAGFNRHIHGPAQSSRPHEWNFLRRGRCGSPRTDGITVRHAGPTIYRPYSGPERATCCARRSPMPPRWPAAMVRPCCIGLPQGSRSGIADGPDLARRLGISVAYHFRAADVAARGAGRRWCQYTIGACRNAQLAAADRGSQHRRGRQRHLCGWERPFARFRYRSGNAVLGDFMHMRTGEPFSGHHRRRAADAGR